jgi:hypothetical protein
VKNSQLPGIASGHISECEEDPGCDIYLRGRESRKISPWQQEILDRLFKSEGLAAAVTEAMKEYETSSKWGGNNYAELAEEDRLKIRQHGIAAYITVSAIVIDDIKHKVILRADTIIDGNLDEHGITIYLSKERWRFDTADYFIRYESNIADSEELFTWKSAEKKWDLLYPPGEPGESRETMADLLIGTWELNALESKELMRRLGVPKNTITHCLGNWEGLGIAVSRELLCDFKWESAIPSQGRYRVLRCDQRGNRFTLQLRHQERTHSGYVERSGGDIETKNFWCERGTLTDDMGRVYRPTDRPAPEEPYKSLLETFRDTLRDTVSEFESLYKKG